jgi:thymidylate synthase (FAD)
MKTSVALINGRPVNVVLEPTVTVIAVPNFLSTSNPALQIPEDGDDCTRLGAFAAKGCYRSFGASGRSNVRNQEAIIQCRHGSVLQHINISLYLEGISRNLSLELNRHSTGMAISQESTRYVEMETAGIVLEPWYATVYREYQHIFEVGNSNLLHGPPGIVHEYLETASAAQLSYADQVTYLMDYAPTDLEETDKRKWARGKARNTLVGGVETRGTWTGNMRTWRYVLEERSFGGAEEEIRRLAFHLFEALDAWAPTYLADYIDHIYEGSIYPVYETPNRKV